MEATRHSLLLQLKSADRHRAWEEFYAVYWAVILSYAKKLGLADADAQDVLQETMVALMSILPDFSYDPGKGKFRNFLLTIVHRKALTAIRRRARRGEVSVDDPGHEGGQPLMDRLAAGDLSETVDREAETRWRESLLEEALRRLADDPDLQENTFAVFRAYVIENRPCQEVADQFNLKPNAVYQIKNRLIGRLREEVALLTEETA